MFSNTAQAQEDNTTTGYISDDLIIYVHSGPGKNYRILGSISAGDQVQIHANAENGYTQITDQKERTVWVESQFVSTTPSLRVVVAELNGTIAANSEDNSRVETQLAEKTAQLNRIERDLKAKNTEVNKLTKQLAAQEEQLSNQDMELKKEWFYTGAIVLGLGLLLGLILPKLSGGKRRSKMESWN